MCDWITDFVWVTSFCKMTDFYLQTVYIVNAPYAVGKLYCCSLGLLTMNTASLARMPYTHQLSRHRCRCFCILELMPFVCVVCEFCCSFCQSFTSPGPLLTAHRRWRTSRQPWWWTSLQSEASHTVVIHASLVHVGASAGLLLHLMYNWFMYVCISQDLIF